MGGTNDKDNLIDLYAREHFEAHRLLAEENPENQKLVLAFWMMCNTSNDLQDRYICTPEEYEKARIMALEIRRGEYWEEIREKISKSMTGEKNPNYKKKWSEEALRNMKAGHKKNPVRCLETNVEYESQAEAGRVMNLDKSHIGRSAKSDGKLAVNGYHFVFVKT